jgi:V/A-type H+-transporting ATPase subunit K
MNMIDATTLALFGVGISVGLGAAGSSLGSGAVAKVGASLLSKQPQKFPQALVLAALPSSQALYGFLYGIIILYKQVS